MSADRWNAALEAAANACEKWADKYRLSTTHRTDDLVAAATMCSQAILALREDDQRGAAARELPAPSEARVAADGGIQPTNTPSCVSVPAETGINAKGDCDSVAQQPAQSAPHHPGGQWRKRPVVVAASQWWKHGDHPAVIEKDGIPWVSTLEGGHVVTSGDWIITGVKGEHYPCKPDIFAATYEPADATQADTGDMVLVPRGRMVKLANELDNIGSALFSTNKLRGETLVAIGYELAMRAAAEEKRNET